LFSGVVVWYRIHVLLRKSKRPAQGRALHRMGISLKKNNETYEKLMTEFRANPIAPDDEASDDDEKAMAVVS